MTHSLKIYTIKSIADANIEVDYSEIPKDLYNLVDEFIRFLTVQ